MEEKTFQTTKFKPRKTKVIAFSTIISIATFVILFLTLYLPVFLNCFTEFNEHICSSYCRKFIIIPCPKNYASSAFEYAFNNVRNMIPIVVSIPSGIFFVGLLIRFLMRNSQNEWTLTNNQIITGNKIINLSDIIKVSHTPFKKGKETKSSSNGIIQITYGNSVFDFVTLKYPFNQNDDGLKVAEYILSYFDEENYNIDFNSDTMKYCATRKKLKQRATSTVDDIKLF